MSRFAHSTHANRCAGEKQTPIQTMDIGRINYRKLNPAAIRALAEAGSHVGSIDERLRALVEVRVSQINGCAYCVDLHAHQAREAGENNQRMDCIAAWHESPFFDARERAAFAWAESLTSIATTHAPDDVYEALKANFTDAQIVDLTLIISFMNAWNRIGVAMRLRPTPRIAEGGSNT